MSEFPSRPGRPQISPEAGSTGSPSAEPSPISFPGTYRNDLDKESEELDLFAGIDDPVAKPRPKAGLLSRSRLLQKVFNRDSNAKNENASEFDVNAILGAD